MSFELGTSATAASQLNGLAGNDILYEGGGNVDFLNTPPPTLLA